MEHTQDNPKLKKYTYMQIIVQKHCESARAIVQSWMHGLVYNRSVRGQWFESPWKLLIFMSIVSRTTKRAREWFLCNPGQVISGRQDNVCCFLEGNGKTIIMKLNHQIFVSRWLGWLLFKIVTFSEWLMFFIFLFSRVSYIEFLKPFALRKQIWRHGNNMLSLLQHKQPELPIADIVEPPQKGLHGITAKLRQKVRAPKA